MSIINESIRKLLRQVHQAWAQPEQEARQIVAIDEAKDAAAVPMLLSIVYSRNGQLSDIAAKAIHRIVTACHPLELMQIDRMIRDVSEYWWKPLAARDVLPVSCGLTGTLGVLSFSGSGYIREAAVQALAEVRDGQELPFLLIRLNDWVQPVREAAKHAVSQRMRSDYATHFSRCLPLIDRIGRQERVDHRPMVDAALGLLRSNRPILREALSATDRRTRRLAWGLLMDGEHEDQITLLHETLHSEDTVMRLWTSEMLWRRLDDSELHDLLARMMRDRFMPIRRQALYGYVERLPSAAPQQLRASLLDPHRSMREAARFFLRDSHPEGFASFYREVLNGRAGEKLAAAIAGLGETGTAEDVRLISPLMSHASVRVRRASVKAIAQLNPEGSIELLLMALQDGTTSVAKVARDALKPRTHWLVPEQLWSIYHTTPNQARRRLVLSLIADLRWWDSAPLLVTAAGSNDQEIAEEAVQYLRHWANNPNRLYVQPRADQRTLLETAMRRFSERLSIYLREDISGLLAEVRRASDGAETGTDAAKITPETDLSRKGRGS